LTLLSLWWRGAPPRLVLHQRSRCYQLLFQHSIPGFVPSPESDASGSVSNDEAKQIFGDGKEPKPYIRIVAESN
jgi:hypothetical protein